MADEEEQLLLLDSGIFNIGSPGSGEEDNNNNNEQQQQGGGKHNNDTIYITPEEKKKNRTGQTEEQFQAVRRSYRAKVENGEIWKSMTPQLPLAADKKVPKHQAQELLHAVEELYFYRRYDEGAALVGRMFAGGGGGDGEDVLVDRETRELLKMYEGKCRQKMGAVTAA